MFETIKNFVKVFTSTPNTAGNGESLVSSKKIWFNVASAAALVVPLIGLITELLKFSDFLSYMQVVYPVAMGGYAIGKYVDGKNYAQVAQSVPTPVKTEGAPKP